MQNIKWGKVLVLLSLVGGIIALDMGIRPMVREAAASQTLSDEAGRLDSIVASFRLRQRARTE